jgi:hypothetical protein
MITENDPLLWTVASILTTELMFGFGTAWLLDVVEHQVGSSEYFRYVIAAEAASSSSCVSLACSFFFAPCWP